jgi:flagellum-specific ATP synthase
VNALDKLGAAVQGLVRPNSLLKIGGHLTELTTTTYRISGLESHAKLGGLLDITNGSLHQLAQVIRIDNNSIVAKPFDAAAPLGVGATAWLRDAFEIAPHILWKGRVVDALARPIDNAGILYLGPKHMLPDAPPPDALKRRRIDTPLRTGIRVIDIFTPICFGQRIGIFAGSGVGKSTLLSMLAKPSGFDTIVIALVGERGREVREFLESMDPDTRRRTISVVSTGDQSPMMRRLAPQTATTIAEYFRNEGDNVLLIVDSITRYAHAAREVALAAGEPPVARGYPPSVFSDLPRLLERAGPGQEGTGSITAIFSVLVDGDDHNDPVADSIRGTLDGHVVLDRTIAEQGRYPAVNPLTSISRLAQHCWSADQHKLVLMLRQLLSLFEETRDIRLLGGYKEGTDALLDRAVMLVPKVLEALKQTPSDMTTTDAFTQLRDVLVAPQ